MAPSPLHDSESEPEDIYQLEDDMEYVLDEDAEVITLDENDVAPVSDDDEENGYIPDDSKMVFTQHEGSVFCLDHSTKDHTLVVTGGEDDKGYVWNLNTGETVFECFDHKDSIISCGFSKDGKYVMTADMSGVVNVRQASDGKKIWDYECTDIEWCKWHTVLNVIFAGTSDGEIYMWKVPSGDCKIYSGHGSKSTSGKVLNNGKELLAGYEDGAVKLWELKSANAIFTFQNESESTICLDCRSNGSIVAFGTSEGNVKIISIPGGKLLHLFSAGINKTESTDGEDEDMEFSNSIESLAFAPNNEPYVASGSLNGNLDIWDFSTERKRHCCKHPAGITRVIWSELNPTIIFTACMDGVIRLWTSLSGELMKEFHGHRENILDMVLSNDNKFILTAGDDETARVFEL